MMSYDDLRHDTAAVVRGYRNLFTDSSLPLLAMNRPPMLRVRLGNSFSWVETAHFPALPAGWIAAVNRGVFAEVSWSGERPTQWHNLKTWLPYYDAVANRYPHLRKNAEVRVDDRLFSLGDLLCLREYDTSRGAGVHTGRFVVRRVTHLLRSHPAPRQNEQPEWLPKGNLVVLSLGEPIGWETTMRRVFTPPEEKVPT